MIGLLLDYTKSLSEEVKHEFLNYFTRNDNTSFIILYGIRAYPLCELNCKRLARIDYTIPTLDGPPEPYRAVKEAVELVNTQMLGELVLLLVWSAPRKPLVDIRVAINYAEANSLELYLVVVHPHSARWLRKTLTSIDTGRVILVERQLNIDKILEKVM